MTTQILGDFYQVERQIAKKAGRKTLLCRDLRSQELVVVKLVSFSSDFEWDDLKLFEREAETLKSLSHRAIPQYLDYFELEVRSLKSFALVQTYIPAKSLKEHLQAGRTFSESEVQELAKALLEILTYLHDRKPAVIHRDLKPSNVLLGDRTGNSIGQVYLVDFGSVQTLAAKEDGTITVVGTYGYMPPEQFGGRTVPASDIYSLGATLICVLTGTHPADLPQKDGCIQFMQQVNISSNFELWLEQTIQPSLDRRFTSASQAWQELKHPPQIKANLPVVEKPRGSKVVLNKDIDSLEIIIPSQIFNSGTGRISNIVFALVGWILFISFWAAGLWLILFPFNLAFHLLILIALYRVDFDEGFDMLAIFWGFFGKIKLSLDRQQMSLAYRVLGFNYRIRSVQIEDITALSYKNYESQNCIKESQIYIFTSTDLYELGGYNYFFKSDYHTLTGLERKWLFIELCNWLGFQYSIDSNTARKPSG